MDYCPEKTAFEDDLAEDGIIDTFVCDYDLGDNNPPVPQYVDRLHVGQTTQFFSVGYFGEDTNGNDFYLEVTDQCTYTGTGSGITYAMNADSGLLDVTGANRTIANLECEVGTAGPNTEATINVEKPCVEAIMVNELGNAPGMYPEEVPVLYEAVGQLSTGNAQVLTTHADVEWSSSDTAVLDMFSGARKGKGHTREDTAAVVDEHATAYPMVVLEDSNDWPRCWDYVQNSDDGAGTYYADEMTVNRDLALQEIFFENAPSQTPDVPIEMHAGDTVTHDQAVDPVLVWGLYVVEGETDTPYYYDITLAQDLTWVVSDTIINVTVNDDNEFQSIDTATEVGTAVVSVWKTVTSDSHDYINGWSYVTVDGAVVSSIQAEGYDIETTCDGFVPAGWTATDVELPQGGVTTTLRAIPTYSDETVGNAIDVTWTLQNAAQAQYLTLDAETGMITTAASIPGTAIDVPVVATYATGITDTITVRILSETALSLNVDTSEIGETLDIGRIYQTEAEIQTTSTPANCFLVTPYAVWTSGDDTILRAYSGAERGGEVETFNVGMTSIRADWNSINLLVEGVNVENL
jgi:hypothetical protein